LRRTDHSEESAPMSIAPYIKEIGRGGAGARSLGVEPAHDLMRQVLGGEASDLEVGAFALAMRMKGETLDELCGFLAAAHERCLALPTGEPAVLLPSYNGARRLPNLTPLLALRLAQEGVRVLVHGLATDPGRVTSAEIFHDLGLPPARDAHDVARAWARHEPAYLPIEALCAPLARLLKVRRIVGVRNSGHTIAKMLNPCTGARALRVVNHTHPEFGALMADFARREGADMALLRGTEGEPVADPRRQPRIEVLLGGQPRPEFSLSAQEGALTALPVLPTDRAAATTAVYVQSVLSGATPAPAPIEQQVQALARAARALAEPQQPMGLRA
jgi:anthranilate phosphoribosyltransferase